MTKPKVAPCGSWASPITSELIVSETVGLTEPQLCGDAVYWLEMRPREKGRCVVLRRDGDGTVTDVTPEPMSVRTRVHEYGGGAYLVDRDAVYFSNDADRRLYVQEAGGAPRALTGEGDIRYADFVMDAARARLITVCEDHRGQGRYPKNFIAAVPLEGGEPRVLVEGCDFYSNPRLSPDGARLSWLSWNHPDMPWDATELWVADILEDSSPGRARRIAGGGALAAGADGESIFQPQWSPEGVLHFVSDRTGWWNLYRWEDPQAQAVCEMEAEFGMPQWVFGMSTYAFAGAGEIICAFTSGGTWSLGRIRPGAVLEKLDLPFTQVSGVCAGRGKAFSIAGGPAAPNALVSIDLATGECHTIRKSTSVEIDAGCVSAVESIEFPTEGGLTAHALFYPPANRDFEAPEGELPPLVVHSHGGPTGAARSAMSLSTQYLTSRGFAVADVNYGGSTGYGREYRKRLEGQWGVVDVDDCCNAARYLVEAGRVDGERLAIAGGSAGGYTTLSALVFRDVFAAGASHYGVSDAETLATDTHKFESRYLDRLIGPYPQEKELYRRRSPIHFVERLSCPVIFFQGLEDEIVPPDQAEKMFEALRERGVPVAYVAFEGEQHGFRQAAHIKRALDGEFHFYSRIFGFEPAEKIEPVEIWNLR